MTPEDMAAITAANHAGGLGWTAKAIADLLATDGAFATTHPHGFALVRHIPPEAELLTIEVRPGHHGRGIGTTLLRMASDRAAEAGARKLHLEVDRENAAALRLYEKAGFEIVGTRRGYYRRADGTRSDALLLACDLVRAP